jgi:hypothetical protein
MEPAGADVGFLVTDLLRRLARNEQRGRVILQVTADMAQDVVVEPVQCRARIPAAEQRAASIYCIEGA